jgi:hypothetical protein
VGPVRRVKYAFCGRAKQASRRDTKLLLSFVSWKHHKPGGRQSLAELLVTTRSKAARDEVNRRNQGRSRREAMRGPKKRKDAAPPAPVGANFEV